MKDRDKMILEYIDRYHIAWPEALQAQPFFDGLSASAVRDVMARLCKTEKLQSYHLGIGARRYYARKELPPERLRIEYAALKFCLTQGVERLSRDDMARLFPSFPKQLICWVHPYVLDRRKDVIRLGQIRVERAKRAQNIVLKHLDSFNNKRSNYPAFDKLVDKQRFTVVIIAASKTLLFGAYDDDPTSLRSLLAYETSYPKHVFLHHEPELLHFANLPQRKRGRNG